MQANIFAIICIFTIFFSLHGQATPPISASNYASATEKIDLNQADISILSHSIKGIGAKRAAAIIKYREDHGKFKAVEDLSMVPGLGEKFVARHLEQLRATFNVDRN